MDYYNEFDPRAAEWLRQLIAKGLLPDGHVDTRSIKEVSPSDLTGYRQCHFFAGIGGWPYALQLAGFDGPCWTGSCPCQPFSTAGKQKGEADDRHLWPEFRRLIAECRPSTVFGEQVASRLGREWLAGVRADLEGVGYAVGAADLCAAGVAAPHLRQRLYWAACGLDNPTSARQPPEGCRQSEQPERGRGVSRLGRESGGMADRCCCPGLEGREEQPTRQKLPSSERGGDAGRVEHAALPENERLRSLKVDLPGPPTGGVGDPNVDGTIRPGREERESDATGEVVGAEQSGLTAPSWTDPDRPNFWSAYDLVHCRDGKTRRVESGALSLVDGVSEELDGLWVACLSEIQTKVTDYASRTETDPEQVLRTLRKGTNPRTLQRPVGGPDCLSEEELLFAALCELKGKLGDVVNRQTPRIGEVPAAELRSVWPRVSPESGSPRPSHRRESAQQLVVELRDVMRKLPPEAPRLLFNGFPLAFVVAGRANLLRGYGNAIVPQVAAEFVRAFVGAQGNGPVL